ncbi:MAG: penicillin-binding protein 2 [Rikenellaceae bacterium]
MNNRSLEIKIFVIAVTAIILLRLFYLQVIDDRYKLGASANAIRLVIQYPPRGEIYDRKGEFLAQSKEAYDLMITPIDVKQFDTLMLCKLLDIDKKELIDGITKAKRYSYRRPSILLKQLSKEAKMRFEEYTFPGFYTQYRTVRSYPFHTGGNILGYVGEVNDAAIKRDDYYKGGDYIGMTGIELAYESLLRGKKGAKQELVDVHGAPQGSYKNGMFDTLPVPGTSITSTIDLDLQLLGEEMMKGKIGSIVAIEPQTGEILMMVSSPTYNPDELIGRNRSKNYAEMVFSPQKPLFNRAVKASYPPGSTFKLAVGLAGLQDKVIKPTTVYSCHGGFYYGNKILKCHSHPPNVDFYYSIQTSCNNYYCNVYRAILENNAYKSTKEAYAGWREKMLSLGFGRKLDSDFLGELSGNIPSVEYYDRIYNGRWNALTTISLSIGQGEIGVTPLQLANFIATIANRGFYYIPHIIRSIGKDGKIDERFYKKNQTLIDKENFELVTEGMWRAVNVGGTASRCAIPNMDVCAKTGTAQNPHGKDHSTFAAFAPRNNPKIAVSVYVENGGFGATIALPIAKIILEKYLLGEVKSVDILENIKNMTVYYKENNAGQ